MNFQKQIFKNKSDFIQGCQDGRAESITLVEVTGWVIPEAPITKGKKHTIIGVDEDSVQVKDEHGNIRVLPLSGQWNFRYHRVNVLNDNTEYIYVVNPMF